MRHYAEEQLIERGEREVACRVHFRYFLQLAEEAEPTLIGSEQVAWLDRLEKEHNNLLAALEWSLKSTETEDGATSEESLRLVKLNSYGYVLWKKKDYVAAQREREKGLVLFRQLGNEYGIAESLHGLGHLAINQGTPSTAQQYLEASLASYRKAGDLLSVYSVMGDLGRCLFAASR